MKTLAKIMIVAALLLTAACSEKINEGEQYKKTVYLVNSANMLYTVEHYYGKSDNNMLISVYCASTEAVTSPLKVQLQVDPAALDRMNAKFALADPLYKPKTLLPERYYRLPDDMTVTIEPGTQYANMHLPLMTDGIDPDMEYVLPVSIVSNDAGYDINPDLQSIVYEVTMSNGFAGTFAGSSAETETNIRSVMPELKALSAFAVRMPIHSLDPLVTGTNYMKLVIGSDSTSVSIHPWEFSNVEDLGGSTYNPRTQSYVLNYRFTNAEGTVFNITEKIRNILAPRTPEEIEYGDEEE